MRWGPAGSWSGGSRTCRSSAGAASAGHARPNPRDRGRPRDGSPRLGSARRGAAAHGAVRLDARVRRIVRGRAAPSRARARAGRARAGDRAARRAAPRPARIDRRVRSLRAHRFHPRGSRIRRGARGRSLELRQGAGSQAAARALSQRRGASQGVSPARLRAGEADGCVPLARARRNLARAGTAFLVETALGFPPRAPPRAGRGGDPLRDDRAASRGAPGLARRGVRRGGRGLEGRAGLRAREGLAPRQLPPLRAACRGRREAAPRIHADRRRARGDAVLRGMRRTLVAPQDRLRRALREVLARNAPHAARHRRCGAPGPCVVRASRLPRGLDRSLDARRHALRRGARLSLQSVGPLRLRPRRPAVTSAHLP
jgi:hypothetical protein